MRWNVEKRSKLIGIFGTFELIGTFGLEIGFRMNKKVVSTESASTKVKFSIQTSMAEIRPVDT